MWYRRISLCVALVCASTSSFGQPGDATLSGSVQDRTGGVISDAFVRLVASDGSGEWTARTDGTGRFRFDGLSDGSYRLRVSRPAFQNHEQTISLEGSLDLTVRLELAAFVQEVVVSANLPEIAALIEVEGRRLEEELAQDTAEFLRQQPEMFSVRRGPINLDPTLRGLQEGQLALFVDGTRTFAAGPARMDSDLSHLSPHAVQSIRVVKGPYALAWGAGALSAIRLETIRPEFGGEDFEVGGRLGYNYGENGDTSDGYATAWGSNDRFRFTVSHNTRVGSDYEDGDGNIVAADYTSYGTRWDFGVQPAEGVVVEYSGGYQEQKDIDYPGRILDATFFKTQSHAFEATFDNFQVGELYVQLYANLKEHLMNNDEKPTALPMAGRVPPFGLEISLPTESDTLGGRASLTKSIDDLEWKFGLDFYRVDQNATRTISRRDRGVTIFQDVVWPDVQIDNVGGYAQLLYALDRGHVGGTVRVDRNSAAAGDASEFFLTNTAGDLDQEDTNVSAAVNATLRLRERWLLNLGLGRSVRSPTTLERYSDRFPAIKFQNAAEFLGNPALEPEKSIEWNVGTSVLSGDATLGVDVFGRRITDYITVFPDSDVTKRLPLSPDAVFRYVNGDAARFFGYELYGDSALGRFVAVRGSLTYVWGEDETFDEPVFGIPPLETHVAARVSSEDGAYWGELELSAVAEQTRVAAARLESPTDGWQRLDFRAGIAPEILRGFVLRLGVRNLTGETYATHLNTLNPFTRERILEPGRAFYVGVEYGF